MGELIDDVARTLASDLPRRVALRRVGGSLIAVFLASLLPEPVAAKKSKGCPTGLTACSASPSAASGPVLEKKSKGGSTVCTNTNSDPNNCGACGTKCAAGQNCTGGKCCPTGQANCGGVCVQTQNDPNNCGGCGTKCPTGQNCVSGSCGGGSCPSGQKRCGTACQQCCNNADCSAGATCTNGACTGGSCPIVESRPASPAGRAEPGDPPLTAHFTTQSTFNGQPLMLEISATDDRNGGLTTRALFSLGGTSLLQVDTRATGGGTETSFDYGGPLGGIDKATCTFDGSLIRCVVDGRGTLPFPPGTDPTKIVFEDGKPSSSLTGDPALIQAIGAIANQAKQSAAGCAPARPGTPEPANRLDACNECEKGCRDQAALCSAGVLAGCAGVTIITLGIGAASCAAGAACTANGIRCLKACTDPGTACCPQKCPVTDACCEKEDRCLVDAPNVVRTTNCCPPGAILCRDNALCCQNGEVCVDNIACCQPGVVTCRGRCCDKGDVCTQAGICCPPGVVGCAGVCCRENEICTPDGACCPPGSSVSCGFAERAGGVLEPICCKQGEACRQVDVVNGKAVKVCCGANNTICGNRCCESTAPCLNGACCDAPNHPCGGACCPPLSTCCNGVCCPESCVNGVCCKAVNICGSSCCADGRICCKGTCCAAGESCDQASGTCQVVCSSALRLFPCPPVPGNPACCNIGRECCPGVGCCATGLQCCSGGINPNFCAVSCVN